MTGSFTLGSGKVRIELNDGFVLAGKISAFTLDIVQESLDHFSMVGGERVIDKNVMIGPQSAQLTMELMPDWETETPETVEEPTRSLVRYIRMRTL